MHQIFVGWGFVQNTTGELTTLPRPPSLFRGWGPRGKGRREGREREGGEGKGKESPGMLKCRVGKPS